MNQKLLPVFWLQRIPAKVTWQSRHNPVIRKGSLDGSNDPKVGFPQEVQSEWECILVKTAALIRLHIKALRENTAQQRFVKRQQYNLSRLWPPITEDSLTLSRHPLPPALQDTISRGPEQRDFIHLQKCPVGQVRRPTTVNATGSEEAAWPSLRSSRGRVKRKQKTVATHVGAKGSLSNHGALAQGKDCKESSGISCVKTDS